MDVAEGWRSVKIQLTPILHPEVCVYLNCHNRHTNTEGKKKNNNKLKRMTVFYFQASGFIFCLSVYVQINEQRNIWIVAIVTLTHHRRNESNTRVCIRENEITKGKRRINKNVGGKRHQDQKSRIVNGRVRERDDEGMEKQTGVFVLCSNIVCTCRLPLHRFLLPPCFPSSGEYIPSVLPFHAVTRGYPRDWVLHVQTSTLAQKTKQVEGQMGHKCIDEQQKLNDFIL